MQHEVNYTYKKLFNYPKLMVILLGFLLLSGFACEQKTVPVNKPVEKTKIDFPQGIPNATKSELVIDKDFQTSLSLQKLPKMWLEFQQNEETKIIEFSTEMKKLFDSRWTELIYFRLKMYSTFGQEEKSQIAKDEILKQLEFNRQIDLIEINSPEGKRRISKEESNFTADLFYDLLRERIEEIDDHFNPKDFTYKLKRSFDKTIEKALRKLQSK